MRRNFLVAGLLLAAGLNLIPNAQADGIDVSTPAPPCSVAECVDAVCDALATEYVAVNCQIQCTMASEAGSVVCPPVCPATASSGWACPPCPVIDLQGALDGSAPAYACPLPCIQRITDCLVCVEPQPVAEGGESSESTIACPDVCDLFAVTPNPCSGPCAVWDMLSPSQYIDCPVCPWPPTTYQACVVCSIRDLCGLCAFIDPCVPPSCPLDDRACHPSPGPWYCTGNGEEPTGIVPATFDYLEDQGTIACVVAGTAATVGIEQAGDTTYYAATQAYDTIDWLRPYLYTARQIDDYGIVDDAAGEAADQGNLACQYLIGDSAACFGGTGPAPGYCPVDFVPDGGVVGATFNYAEAACASADGAADALRGDVQEALIDVVATVRALEQDVGEYADGRVEDAGAFAAETSANAGTVADAAVYGVTATVANTCGYALGTYTCT